MRGCFTLFAVQEFTGKHLQACNFIKKETLAQVFSSEFCETSKNTFFTEHLWTVSGKMPPGKLTPEKCPRENCPPENYLPEISPPGKLFH